jgi:hypothetical protein
MSYWYTFWQQNNYIQRRLSNKFPRNYSNYTKDLWKLDMLEYYLITRCRKMVQKKIIPPSKYPCVRMWSLRLQISAVPGPWVPYVPLRLFYAWGSCAPPPLPNPCQGCYTRRLEANGWAVLPITPGTYSLNILFKYFKYTQICLNILEYTWIFPCQAGAEVYRVRQTSGPGRWAHRQPWPACSLGLLCVPPLTPKIPFDFLTNFCSFWPSWKNPFLYQKSYENLRK